MPPKITPVTEEEILDAVGKEDEKQKPPPPPKNDKENATQSAEKTVKNEEEKTDDKKSNETSSKKGDNTKISVKGTKDEKKDEVIKQESYAALSEDDLEKLVPIFLEDSADGNCESIKQILDLDSKTDQYSIIKQSDDEGR